VALGITALIKRRDTVALIVAAAAFILAVTLLRAAKGVGPDWGFEVRRVVIYRVDAIAYGALLWIVAQRISLAWWWVAMMTAVSGCATYLIAAHTGSNHMAQTAFPFAAALFGSASILLMLSVERLFGARARAAAIFGGQISYSIYLFHIVGIILLTDTPIVIAAPAYALGLVFVCAAFYRYFERPILAMRPQYSSRAQGQNAAAFEAGPPVVVGEEYG
jgi:peptidoglycan/LPS O-acetylase OafA/YrhL